MRHAKVMRVRNILKTNKVTREEVSPNTVNYYANLFGIELTSEEVIYISDTYK